MTPEEMAQKIIHECPFIEAFGILEDAIAGAIEESKRDEREACARVAETCEHVSPNWGTRKEIARRIRARKD